jgi:hypothetical protein
MLLLLAAPFAGYRYLGIGGLLGGFGLLNLAAAVFFLRSRRRGFACEACHRPVICAPEQRAAGPSLPVIMSSAAIRDGRVSPGSLCRRCGAIYCGCSYPQYLCVCGSEELRTVGLEYPGR